MMRRPSPAPTRSWERAPLINLGRNDSPWYPTAVCSANRLADWQRVMAIHAGELCRGRRRDLSFIWGETSALDRAPLIDDYADSASTGVMFG
jgi:hypothetical protein